MSPLSIENVTASALSATSRTAESRFSADERDLESFDEQLRHALKPAAPKETKPAGGKAADKPDSREDAEKSDKTRAEEEPDADEGAEDVAGDCRQTAPDPQAEENPAEQNSDGETNIDESCRSDNTSASDADAQSDAMLQEEAASQSELPSAAQKSAVELLQSTQQGESSADATAGESLQTTNDGEVVPSDGSLATDGEEQDAATSDESGELNRRESMREAAEGDAENATATVAETARDGAGQNIAVVSKEASNRSAKEADERHKSAESSADGEETGAEKAAPTQAAAAVAATLEVEVSAVEDLKKSTAEMSKKNSAGDAKTAAIEANPVETPLGQRLADARESRAATAAAQTDSGDASDAVDRAKFVQRVAKAFEGMGSEGGSVRIRLHPAELGSLRLEVAVRDGALTARLETESNEAKNILLDNLPALRERLAGQNIKIERFDVDYSGGNSGGSSQDASDYQQTDRQAESRQPESQLRRNQNGNKDTVSAATLPRRPGAASRLDFVA